MVPKSGDLSDPNKWRGINLMDVCSKIFSIILNGRLYTLLGEHGTKCQFGATPNKGCRDGSFTLKTLLTQRKEHGQESFVLFVDLVKAYDTVNHELLIEILEQYGAPPKICSAIKRMYTDLTVRITLDGVSAEIPQTVGVRQGDNLSPVLFLFFMSAFAESLETEWEHQGLGKAEFVRTPAGEVGNDFGQLTSHPLIDSNCPTPYGEGWIFEILQLLYIDDGAFVFNNRADLERGAEVVNKHFKNSEWKCTLAETRRRPRQSLCMYQRRSSSKTSLKNYQHHQTQTTVSLPRRQHSKR